MNKDILEALLVVFITSLNEDVSFFDYDVSHYIEDAERKILDDIRSVSAKSTSNLKNMSIQDLEKLAKALVISKRKVGHIKQVCKLRRYEEEKFRPF